MYITSPRTHKFQKQKQNKNPNLLRPFGANPNNLKYSEKREARRSEEKRGEDLLTSFFSDESEYETRTSSL